MVHWGPQKRLLVDAQVSINPPDFLFLVAFGKSVRVLIQSQAGLALPIRATNISACSFPLMTPCKLYRLEQTPIVAQSCQLICILLCLTLDRDSAICKKGFLLITSLLFTSFDVFNPFSADHVCPWSFYRSTRPP